MSIVFISAKQRQRMFFMGITILFVLVLLVISLSVFLSRPQPAQQELVFNRPKIDINLQVLELDQVKILEPAEQIDLQFKYTATTKKGVKTAGIITAISQEAAQKILQGMQLSGVNLEESKAGRENPFAPYYSPVALPLAKIKKIK